MGMALLVNAEETVSIILFGVGFTMLMLHLPFLFTIQIGQHGIADSDSLVVLPFIHKKHLAYRQHMVQCVNQA